MALSTLYGVCISIKPTQLKLNVNTQNLTSNKINFSNAQEIAIQRKNEWFLNPLKNKVGCSITNIKMQSFDFFGLYDKRAVYNFYFIKR